MTPIHTLQSKDGRTVKIYQDSDGGNPREWSNLGTIAYKRNGRYVLGDTELSEDQLDELEADPNVISRPVFAMIHGSIMLKAALVQDNPFSCPWDSGQCGLVYATRETIAKEYGVCNSSTIHQAIEVMRCEVNTFSQYLNGEVYGYVIEDAEGKELDSCWGFVGESPELLALSALRGEI